MSKATIYKVGYAVQVATFTQVDAKLANGVYWAKFWIALAVSILF